MSSEWIRVLLGSIVASSAGVVHTKEISITSEPPGARVVVQGNELGTTPVVLSRNEIMPGWPGDFTITRATISVEHPLYLPQTLQVSELRMPREFHAVLERRQDLEQFEDYLAEVPDLSDSTVPAPRYLVRVSDDIDTDAASLYKQGYVMVGRLGISLETVPMELIRERGAQQQAAIILVTSRVESVQTEMKRVVTHISGSSTVGISTGSATGQASGFVNPGGGAPINWGASGSGSYRGTQFSFTPGRSASTFVPLSQYTYQTQASFWRRRAPNPLGAHVDSLPQDLRQQLGRNTGAYVLSVDDDTPAFFAELIAGDVIIELSGQPVRRPKDVPDWVEREQCRPCQMTVIRGMEEVILQVRVD